jgi:hypothetical protein
MVFNKGAGRCLAVNRRIEQMGHFVYRLIFVFFTVAFWVPALGAQEGSPQSGAVLLELGGVVEAYRVGSTGWAAAARGERYADKDMLSTGEESWAVLEFHQSHRLRMQANTELSIRKLRRTSEKADEVTEINLTKGEILNRVRKLPTKGSIYTIHTPTATSSVRGTRFAVKVYEKDGEWLTEIQVLDGVVEITNRAGRQLRITDAEEAEISELSIPEAPEKMDAASQASLEKEMAGVDQPSSVG